jgi:hypothetical protein
VYRIFDVKHGVSASGQPHLKLVRLRGAIEGSAGAVNLQNVRWPVVLVTVAVTVAALFGAGFVLKSQTIEEPLKKVYAASPALVSYTMERQGDQYVIKTLLKDVPDLAQAYKSLDESTAKVMKGLPYKIEVEDRRSEKLEQNFRRVNLYVQEALATGRFATMSDRVEAEAAKDGLSARLSVDNDRVYVEMHDQGSYLFHVASRTPQAKTAVEEGGMGL